MVECPKTNEIPIFADRLKGFDTDNSGGFSAEEMEKMDAHDIGLVFVDGLQGECAVNADTALNIYEDLSQRSRLAVISGCRGETTDPVTRFRELLIEKDCAQLAKDLFQKWKDTGSDNIEKYLAVNLIVSFIRYVPIEKRETFFKALENIDSELAENVRKGTSIEIKENRDVFSDSLHYRLSQEREPWILNWTPRVSKDIFSTGSELFKLKLGEDMFRINSLPDITDIFEQSWHDLFLGGSR